MRIKHYPAEERGKADHGWLKTRFSFSFAHYYDPQNIQFGALRVLNDDHIAPDNGFGMHPHDNMEIITIPFKGALTHKDSMGNQGDITAGEIQAMSAGTGILHSEFNNSKSEAVELFQIWIIPNKTQVTPRYQQINIAALQQANALYQILSPNPHDDGVWIHQNAWMYKGDFDTDTRISYSLNQKENGVYLMLIEGNISLESYELGRRDAVGIYNTDGFEFEAAKDSQVLLIEVPMR
ncbi:MAG: pirin family protein [Flavobacteriaceae bacterium]|nr:pirin family protein [Flavobacteriaceae bacterium]